MIVANIDLNCIKQNLPGSGPGANSKKKLFWHNHFFGQHTPITALVHLIPTIQGQHCRIEDFLLQ
jgi:hypothetical protein